MKNKQNKATTKQNKKRKQITQTNKQYNKKRERERPNWQLCLFKQ